MYNDELDMALESAYEDGYYQALADMGYEFDDEASEDVDIFDEGYFDEAMEGPAREYRRERNKDRSHDDIRNERRVTGHWENDPNTGIAYNKELLYGRRHNVDPQMHALRESELKSRKGAANVSARTQATREYGRKLINDPDFMRRSALAGNRAARKMQLDNDQRLINAQFAPTKGEASRIIHK